MSRGRRSFSRAGSVRVSTTLLAVFFAVTVVGLIPAALMLAWAWGRVELDDAGIRLWPFGGRMAWSEVRRLGVGIKTGAIHRNDPAEISVSTVHALLRDAQGRTLAIHCASFAEGHALLQEIKRRAGVHPEPLDVSLILNRLSFRE